MNGFNVAEGGHAVQLIPPQTIGGGVVSQAFNMGLSEHVSIIIQFGVFGATAPTSIQLVANASITQSLTSPPGGTAIPFRYYFANELAAGTLNDQLSPPVYAAAAGLLAAAISKLNNTFLVIELDSAELDFLGDSDKADFPYLQVVITNGAFPTLCSAVAIMSGVRQAYQGQGNTGTPGQTATF
jgi:hypothetical protein